MELHTFNSDQSNQIFTIKNQQLDKKKLLRKLNDENIYLNEFAYELINCSLFNLKNLNDTTSVIELSLQNIGLTYGGNFSDIESAIRNSNIISCPIELAPYLRLQYTNQPESKVITEKQHPDESVIIFSKPIIRNDEFPKGFYLRNYDGKLWLRGYRCSEDYVWNAKDRMLFQLKT